MLLCALVASNRWARVPVLLRYVLVRYFATDSFERTAHSDSSLYVHHGRVPVLVTEVIGKRANIRDGCRPVRRKCYHSPWLHARSPTQIFWNYQEGQAIHSTHQKHVSPVVSCCFIDISLANYGLFGDTDIL